MFTAVLVKNFLPCDAMREKLAATRIRKNAVFFNFSQIKNDLFAFFIKLI